MLRLTKHHGLGNDFLIALADDNPGLSVDPSVARAVCDRRRGVGADGLLLGLPVDHVPAEDDGAPAADVRMVLLNSDGSRAEISGNGLRCLAQAVLARRGRDGGELVVETDAGPRHLRTVRGDVRGELWVEVDLGPARPGPRWQPPAGAGPAQPVTGLRSATTVDLGNPHLVLVVDEPAEVDLQEVGPVLERSFAEGINVHVVAPRGQDRVELRVWERGAGITEACGSGAAAAAVVAHVQGHVGSTVVVEMPGGEATVVVSEESVLLTGPTRHVAEVVVP